MNGGDTDTGGAKVNPNNTPSLTPQPDTSTASDAEAESILTISHDDHPTSVGPQPISQPATAEPAVPPTPPVQSAPSTTVSTPTTQPASSTMPVPPITDFPQSTPQAPQPVGQPVAPVVTPANPFTSPTATTLPPQPLTPSQFPQQSVQFPAQSMPAGSGDVVLGSSAPKKSRKGLIIVLILLAVLVIGAIVALVVFQSSRNSNSGNQSSQNNTEQFTTKEEVYDNLFKFNNRYYSNLIQHYEETIGLEPNLKMSDHNATLFPLETKISSIVEELKEAMQAYNELSPKIPDQLDNGSIDIWPTKESISQSLQAMDTNINILNDFYNAYILPLVGESRSTTCDKTPAMISLEQGATIEAAQKYFTVYCQTIEFLNKSEDFEALQQNIRPLTDSAAESLNSILIDVPSAEKDISKLFKELTE